MWLSLLLAVGWLGLAKAQITQQWIQPNKAPIVLTTPGYPSIYKATYPIEWIIRASGSTKCRARCQIDLKNTSPTVCNTNVLYRGNTKQEKICTTVKDSIFESDGNMLIIDVSNGISSVRCEVDAIGDPTGGSGIKPGSNGESSGKPSSGGSGGKPSSGGSGGKPPSGGSSGKPSNNGTGSVKPPTSSKSPFFSSETLEIDSTEHGGPPGKVATTCPCGRANKKSLKVVGGREAGVNEYPFAAVLVEGPKDQFFCGGAIVSPRQVVTAAHCLVRRMSSVIHVLVGAHNIQKSGSDDPGNRQRIEVSRKTLHFQYDPMSMRNDIAILLLAQPMEFNNEVGPVCLPKQPINIEKQPVKLLGWGLVGERKMPSPVLKTVNLRVVPLEACAKRMVMVSTGEWKSQICTYGKDKGACSGDSGGPLVWLNPKTNRYTLVGVVSFGRVCASLDPTVYTEVGRYVGWIRSRMMFESKEEMCTQVE